MIIEFINFTIYFHKEDKFFLKVVLFADHEGLLEMWMQGDRVASLSSGQLYSYFKTE